MYIFKHETPQKVTWAFKWFYTISLVVVICRSHLINKNDYESEGECRYIYQKKDAAII